MAKNVFRPQEIVTLTKRVQLDSPFEEEATTVEIEPFEEYAGPTADDLRREAEAFKASWEQEKATMVAEARAEAERIVKEGEQRAFDEVKRLTDDAQKIRQEAEDEKNRLLSETSHDAERKVRDAEDRVTSIETTAQKEGFEAGRVDGWEEGNAESKRLAEQLHRIINATIEKRNEIIDESETQLINLVLQISKKVVKVISENQKNVVINNCIQALRKLKSRGDVVIRVNLEDVKMTSDHINDFMRMVENVRTITVMEDTSVDKGGCIIETDFGQIDARISNQFKEIEEKILDLTPIRIESTD